MHFSSEFRNQSCHPAIYTQPNKLTQASFNQTARSITLQTTSVGSSSPKSMSSSSPPSLLVSLFFLFRDDLATSSNFCESHIDHQPQTSVKITTLAHTTSSRFWTSRVEDSGVAGVTVAAESCHDGQNSHTYSTSRKKKAAILIVTVKKLHLLKYKSKQNKTTFIRTQHTWTKHITVFCLSDCTSETVTSKYIPQHTHTHSHHHIYTRTHAHTRINTYVTKPIAQTQTNTHTHTSKPTTPHTHKHIYGHTHIQTHLTFEVSPDDLASSTTATLLLTIVGVDKVVSRMGAKWPDSTWHKLELFNIIMTMCDK